MEGHQSPQTVRPVPGAVQRSWRLDPDVVRVVAHTVSLTVPAGGTSLVARITAVLAALASDDPFADLARLGAQLNPDAAVGAAVGPAVTVTAGNRVRVSAATACDHAPTPAPTPAAPSTGPPTLLITRAPCGCLAAGPTRFQPVIVLETTVDELRHRSPPVPTLPEPPTT